MKLWWEAVFNPLYILSSIAYYFGWFLHHGLTEWTKLP